MPSAISERLAPGGAARATPPPIRPPAIRHLVHAWSRTPGGGLVMLIAGTFLARLLFAASLGLGIDESYMVAIARTLHLGYFDHPPIAWWLAWSAMRLFRTDQAVIVRLPFMLLFALSTWLMFCFTQKLFGARAALWAAILLNAVPVLGITAGSWVLPDGPLIAAMLAAACCLISALRAAGAAAWRWWLALGLCCGLGLCAKYTAIPIGGGILFYLLTDPAARPWLCRPHPYAAAGLAFALFAPVIAWNADHGWASLLFQGGRAAGGRWHPFGPVATLAGEALFFLPWIWLPLMLCLWQAARRGPADAPRWLPLCLATPTIILFALVSLRGHVLYHWAAPGTMMALPLLGDAIARQGRHAAALRRVAVTTAAVMIFALAVIGTEVRFNWLPEVLEDFSSATDPDLDAVDWTTLRQLLPERIGARSGVVVGAINWHDAGKIDYALGGQPAVICLGGDPREYGIAHPASVHAGEDVLIVAPRQTLGQVTARYATLFDSFEALAPIVLLHAGRPAMPLALVIGHRLQSDTQRIAAGP